MAWYHISEEADQACIIPSDKNEPRKPGCMSPKKIEKARGFGEDATKRLCVAPTMGECIVSKPWKHT